MLEEYKQIVAAYSTSKTSYALNYYGLQSGGGGGGAGRCAVRQKKTKKDHKVEEKLVYIVHVHDCIIGRKFFFYGIHTFWGRGVAWW